MEKDITRRKIDRMRIMKLSTLQVCLLSIFLEDKKGKEHSIEDLSSEVYLRTGKRRPVHARQSITGMVRDITQKIYPLGASIDRVSGTGRSATGKFVLNGDLKELRELVERMILK